MAAREHEERSHSAWYLILIFLACVATCGVFFSLGFLVGYNERASRSAPPTEVVTPPSVIPPTVNPPPESAQIMPPQSAAGRGPVNPPPDTLATPPADAGTHPAAPAAKPADVTPSTGQPPATAQPAPNPPAPAGGEVGEGITLQVAALRTKPDAEHLVDILKERGYPVFLVTPEYAHADDNLFRVLVGPFMTRPDADKVHDKLVQEGFKPFIKH